MTYIHDCLYIYLKELGPQNSSHRQNNRMVDDHPNPTLTLRKYYSDPIPTNAGGN